MNGFRERYLSARYNLFPDHVLGEILAKRWADNAIPFFTLIIVALGLFFILPGFYTSYNLTEYGRQYAELGLIVLGMTVVMMAGGLDLSVGSIFAIANLVALYCVHVLDLHPFLTIPTIAVAVVDDSTTDNNVVALSSTCNNSSKYDGDCD